MDEIQTGIGRTGKFFAYQHAEIKPDVILFAKGIGGGLPLGGIIVAERFSHLFQPGDHGTTFAPSPLSAALGNTVIDVLMEDGQLEVGSKIAKDLYEELTRLQSAYPDMVVGVRGKGMMLGLVMNLEPADVKSIQHQLLDNGFMVDVTQQTIIRLLPPLTLTSEEVRLLIGALEQQLQLLLKVGERQ
jgi:acetylornithine aminotransferase